MEPCDSDSEFISFYGNGCERVLRSLFEAGARKQLKPFGRFIVVGFGSLCKRTFYSMFSIELTE